MVQCTDILINCAIYTVSTWYKTYVICVCIKFVQLTLFQHCIKHMSYVSVSSLVKQVTRQNNSFSLSIIWSKDYTSEVQLGPIQGPMVQVIWSKDYTDPKMLPL